MSKRDILQVLVVDDMSTSRGLIVQSLEAMGIKKVEHAASGQEACGILSRKPIHLVISDYNMPDMDGIQLLKTIRQNGPTQKLGFILITGRPDSAILNQGRTLGMNNFIKKPFTTHELKACLEAVVGRL